VNADAARAAWLQELVERKRPTSPPVSEGDPFAWADRTAALVPENRVDELIDGLRALVVDHHTFRVVLAKLEARRASQSRDAPRVKKATTPQDYATIRGWGVVTGLEPGNAAKLAATLEAPRFYKVTHTSDSLRAAVFHGPVLGAWPADIRRMLRNVVDAVQPSASVEVEGTVREVVATRAEYDKRKSED